ncbi:hypothetical protein H1B31_03820 [Selenomonas timonae]|uniref:Uncharacterized protein n=1 Tax=Selenomonas timonae TaxID=2754044 RepID=A0A7G7VLS5_9FIRM|nr:hypothetical protein [Selenomonas timonae]QNH55068.1 hypothetical protein H1B31_03820 [Selenomonas timonae]
MRKIILVGCFTFCITFSVLTILILFAAFNTNNSQTPQVSQTSEESKKATEQTESETQKPTSQAKTTSTKRTAYDIGMTEESFRTNYNNFMDAEFSGTSLYLLKAPEYHGKNANVYEHYFSDSLSLLVSYDPSSNKVKGMILGATPSNELDAINMISVITGLVSVTSPDLSADGKRKLLQSIGMFREGGTNYRTIKGSTQHNNITYAIKGNGSGGITFFVCGKDVTFGGGGSADAPHDLLADLTHYLTWLDNHK